MADEIQIDEAGSGDELSDEQLDELLSQVQVDEDEGTIDFNQELSLEEKAEETEESETDEADEEAADEEVASEESEDEDAEEAAEEDSEPAEDPAMEAILQRLEVMETERDALKARLERAELLRDRNAGKLGSLMQQMNKGS